MTTPEETYAAQHEVRMGKATTAEELAAKILALRPPRYDGRQDYDARCRGHRDARHAAAELVTAWGAEQAATIASEQLLRHPEPGNGWTDVEQRAIYAYAMRWYRAGITLGRDTPAQPQPVAPAAEPAHDDHPLRHWDRTCPACVAEPAEPAKTLDEQVAGLMELVNTLLDEAGDSHSQEQVVAAIEAYARAMVQEKQR